VTSSDDRGLFEQQRKDDSNEARCELCGETFVYADPSDLMHFQRRSGVLCGGEGVPFRKYVIRKNNRT
jgi:hypothetical protein